MEHIKKLADKFEEKIDRNITLEEHDVKPVSYMAYSNLKNIIKDSEEILSMMNEDDDLPQWADEMLAVAKHQVSKVMGYIRSEKSE